MPPKGGLAAALSGAPTAHAHAPSAKAKKSFLDPAAFPCIPYAEETQGVTTHDESAQEEESDPAALGLAVLGKDFDVVGSMPMDLPKTPGGKIMVRRFSLRRSIFICGRAPGRLRAQS